MPVAVTSIVATSRCWPSSFTRYASVMWSTIRRRSSSIGEAAFRCSSQPPLDNYREIRDLRMLGLGWNIHSPPFDAAVARLGLSDLYQATYANPNVYLFAVPYSLQQLQRFVLEHDRQAIVVKRADHLLADSDRPPDYFATDFSVYQMAPQTDSASTEQAAAPGSDKAVSRQKTRRLH